jgi:hypothetical protein
LTGQYPFNLGNLSLFPIIGIEYDMNLGVEDSAGASDTMAVTYKTFWNILFLIGGLGADVSMGSSFFLRPQLIFGWKPFSTEYDKAEINFGKTFLGYTDIVAT